MGEWDWDMLERMMDETETRTRGPLTAEQVETLRPGALIEVIWSGGNGPHRYVVHVDKWGRRFAGPPHLYNPLDFIGRENFHTRVWVVTSD